MKPDFLFNLYPCDLSHDIETFPNAFTVWFIDINSERKWYFEVSPWRNDFDLFMLFIERCRELNCRWVGFNSLTFDYPVIHFMYKNREIMNVDMIYTKAMQIIDTPFNRRHDNMVWQSDWIVEQIDLVKVHHFDNAAKLTSLKVLEFNMRSEHLATMPVENGTVLTKPQLTSLSGYNYNDTTETKLFCRYSLSAIEMRESLSKQFNEQMMNFSDVKIGERILIRSLEDRGIKCFYYDGKKKKKLQTERDEIYFGNIIFPYIKLDHPELRRIYADLSEKRIKGSETKGAFKDLDPADIAGVKYKFGTGGLHASVNNKIYVSNETHQIVDVDVASYYPNLAIKNSLFPEHLGIEFCEAYEDLYITRTTFPKGTSINEAYKLGLNGAYGMSNNDHSALKDPQYTMSITVNGQLLLAMLVDQLIKVEGLEMIQANTDGVTYYCPRWALEHTRNIAKWWMQVTKLELEEALYSRMFVRDVNSYIAEYESGKLKRIGAYAHETADVNPGTRELPWHKDWSFRVVALAAEAYLVRGIDIRQFIEGHEVAYDFFGKAKVNKSSQLTLGGEKVPSVIRYYVSEHGDFLKKIMPPTKPEGTFKRTSKLSDWFFNEVIAEIGEGVWDARIHTKNKSVHSERVSDIHGGYTVELVEHYCAETWETGFSYGAEMPFNYEFYIKEAEKLVKLK